MERWFGKYSEVLYAVMRVVVGLLFACHGAQKLFGVLGGQTHLSDPMLVAAGVIEFVGGSLVALRLWAGYAAFVASGEMAVAYSRCTRRADSGQSSTRASSRPCTASSSCMLHPEGQVR